MKHQSRNGLSCPTGGSRIGVNIFSFLDLHGTKLKELNSV